MATQKSENKFLFIPTVIHAKKILHRLSLRISKNGKQILNQKVY
jgi:hypothetical protein